MKIPAKDEKDFNLVIQLLDIANKVFGVTFQIRYQEGGGRYSSYPTGAYHILMLKGSKEEILIINDIKTIKEQLIKPSHFTDKIREFVGVQKQLKERTGFIIR